MQLQMNVQMKVDKIIIVIQYKIIQIQQNLIQMLVQMQLQMDLQMKIQMDIVMNLQKQINNMQTQIQQIQQN